MSWLQVLLGGLVAAAATAGSPAPEHPAGAEAQPQTKQRYVVAAMGDSLTDPKSHGGKYLEVLQQRCPKSRFDSYGVGGQMVNQMRRRFARDVLGDPPDPDEPKPKYTHVLILGGINDICSDRSALRTNDKIKRDLSAMYELAKDRGIQVVALTMPPWAGFKRYYNRRREASTLYLNQWIRSRSEIKAVGIVFDTYPLLSCGRPTHLCDRYGWSDHVHWNKKGHRVVGEALHREVFADCE
jgi:lysophospholipase L1-like esterase